MTGVYRWKGSSGMKQFWYEMELWVTTQQRVLHEKLPVDAKES